MSCLFSSPHKSMISTNFMNESSSRRQINCILYINLSDDSTKQPKADSINVNIKLFHGDRVEDVVQAHPTILLSVPPTNRVGFNDVPLQSRSDIFITVTKAINTCCRIEILLRTRLRYGLSRGQIKRSS